MEHSYSRDFIPKENVEVMATRTILIPRAPQCPSCHHHSNEDVLSKFDNHQPDSYFDQVPPAVNDKIANMAIEESERLTKNAKNLNLDDEDWDLKVAKIGWSKQQLGVYRQISAILDYDQLARLAINGRPNEVIIRRCNIDKSVSRMRLALSSVHWDIRLTQWLHSVLSDHLPPSYMTSYIDILQALHAKVPSLVEKMISARPVSFHQDYLQAVMKRPWGANVPTKSRKLPGQQPVILIVPSSVYSPNQPPSSRLKRWFALLSTMTTVVPIQHAPRQPTLEHVTEQLIAATRSKVQELRTEAPTRHIILVGINAGAAIALQVALVEAVSSIVCLGFAFNTLRGTRGAPDDRILDITTPILFVLGENAQRSSQEEIESLREKMSAQTSLVVVGAADDALRIRKFSRHMEGVTQSMVDNMIADEVQDFVSTCIVNPPGPREVANYYVKRSIGVASSEKLIKQKKRKHKDSLASIDGATPRKVGRPRLNKTNEIPTGKFKPERPKPTSALLKQSNESLRIAIQNILPPNDAPPVNLMSTDDDVAIALDEPTIINTSDLDGAQILSAFEVVSSDNTSTPTQQSSIIESNSSATMQIPLKLQPNSQFVQLNPPTTSGRVQSPGVKNFYIRKGVEKKPTTQSYVTLRPGELTTSSQPSSASTTPRSSPNKKIVIQNQQTIKAGTIQSQIIQSLPTTILNGSNLDSVVTTSAAELSNILDLPILFADNEGNLQDHSASESNATPSIQAAPMDTSTSSSSNILITSPDGKLPNRPVVISAANVSKIGKSSANVHGNVTTSGNNKLIFINRKQLNSSTSTSQAMPNTVKSMSTVKLVSTGGASGASTGGTFTKLAPGTKIDLSTLKIVKGTTAAGASNILFNKTQTQAGRGTIVIKPNVVQPNQMIKTGILNRNITVRKVVNLMQSPRASSTPVGSPTVDSTNTTPNTSGEKTQTASTSSLASSPN